MANHTTKKTGAIGVFAVTTVFTIALIVCNWHETSLNLCGLSTGMSLALGFVFAWIMGVAGGLALVAANDKSALNQEKKLAWEAQDAKLMASVASDKEKQLEAKITTLEAALKTALKRREQ